MHKILIMLLFICTGVNSMSQGNKELLTGAVVCMATRQPVSGATIKSSIASNGITDEEGRFYLPGNFTETDSLNVTAIGYKHKMFSVKEVLQQKALLLDKEEIMLQEVVVAGRSNPTQVISKLDVSQKGISNTQEILRIVPGLFIGQHAGGGKAEQIFLRGFDIDHGTDINITVDGMPVNMVSHAHGQGYADLHFVIPELLQDVQFKKGSYNAEKGNFTTAGFVDFRTKRSLDKNNVIIEAGQYNTFRNVLMLNLLDKENEKNNWYAASEYLFSKGYFDHPQNLHRINLFTKYHSALNQNNKLTVTASYFKSNWKASGQVPERSVASGDISFFGAIDPNEGGNTSRSNINLQLSSVLSNNATLNNQLYFTGYNFDLFSNFTFFLNDPVNGDEIRQKEKRKIIGYNNSYTYVQFAGSKKLTSQVGVQTRLDLIDDVGLANTKSQRLIQQVQQGDVKEMNAAIFASQTIKWSKLSINAGARFDVFTMLYTNALNNNKRSTANSSIFSPKLNIYFDASERTELYASFGKGFHSNDTRVVLTGNTKNILPAAYTTDLGINFKPVANLFINAALWNLNLDQEFVYVGDEGIVEPGGRTIRRGADLTVRYQPLKSLFIDVDVNYAYARAMDETKGNNYLPLAPSFTSSGGISYKATSGFSFNTRYRYMGNRPATEDNSIVAKGYFITDASTGFTKKGLSINVSVQNLFNKKWKETQFATESRLRNEAEPVKEIHFTPGTPFFIKTSIAYSF